VDVPAKVGLGRLKSKDRLESEPIAFHERVRQEFLSLSMLDPERYLVVDGRQSVSAIEKIIRNKLAELKVLSK
jgi:dTMP kinase